MILEILSAIILIVLILLILITITFYKLGDDLSIFNYHHSQLYDLEVDPNE